VKLAFALGASLLLVATPAFAGPLRSVWLSGRPAGKPKPVAVAPAPDNTTRDILSDLSARGNMIDGPAVARAGGSSSPGTAPAAPKRN
jgi:hypothetical protein